MDRVQIISGSYEDHTLEIFGSNTDAYANKTLEEGTSYEVPNLSPHGFPGFVEAYKCVHKFENSLNSLKFSNKFTEKVSLPLCSAG